MRRDVCVGPGAVLPGRIVGLGRQVSCASLPRGMSAHRTAARWLIVLVVLSVAAPLLAEDACEEACGAHCGDCAWCPLAADLHVTADPVRVISADLPPSMHRTSHSDSPRALDHVPLPS